MTEPAGEPEHSESSLQNSWTNCKRSVELSKVLPLLPVPSANVRILEIGGGNGHLSRSLADMNYSVTCTDPFPRKAHLEYPVTGCFADDLPFPDDSFDVVFSSNVLEHISNLQATFCELDRVLKPTGSMIHTLPTSANIIVTILTWPIAYVRNLLLLPGLVAKRSGAVKEAIQAGSFGGNGGKQKVARARHPIMMAASKFLGYINPLQVIHPHGVFESRIHEIGEYSESRWRERFEQLGFVAYRVTEGGVLYSMNRILPFPFLLRLRQVFASAIGSSALIYALKRKVEK